MAEQKTTLFTREELSGDNNLYRTQSLFWELRYAKTNEPVMVLGRTPHSGLPSIYVEYMKFDTEYEAAMWILGDWKHWQALCKLSWFQKHKKEWDAEKETRQKAMAKNTLLDAAAGGNVTAAKIVYEENVPKRGRPTKAEKEAALNSEVKLGATLSSITERMKKHDK